ncbi:MAG TPA: tetratricopeptide repeat protein [Terriglobales bacterium]|nr:tetratricopeptide repeat protein [Terriglobales bacterium]
MLTLVGGVTFPAPVNSALPHVGNHRFSRAGAPSIYRGSGVHMLRRGLSCLVVALLLSSLAFAQRPGGNTGGNAGGGRPSGGGSRPMPDVGDLGRMGMPRASELIIRVVYPDDRSVPSHVSVQLMSFGGVTVAQGFTNSEGQVTFANVKPGSYTAKISGADLEDTTTEAFVIDRSDPMHMEWVHVKRRQDGTQVGSTQPMISAADLRIPDKAKKEFNKGNESFVEGDMEKAIERYQKAVKIYPDYATAHNNLGAAFMRMQRRDEALEAFAKAAELDPNLASANANVARFHILANDGRAAIPFLERALSSSPGDAEVLVLMAQAQLMTQHFDEAVTYARKAHSLAHQKLPMVHLIAGQALQAQNKPDEARIEYEIFLKEAPDSPQVGKVRSVIGQLAASAGRPR